MGKIKKKLEKMERKANQREKKIETIEQEKEIEQEKSGVRKWTEENDNEMGNIVNPYYKL